MLEKQSMAVRDDSKSLIGYRQNTFHICWLPGKMTMELHRRSRNYQNQEVLRMCHWRNIEKRTKYSIIVQFQTAKRNRGWRKPG
jgi:hypothetical protein